MMEHASMVVVLTRTPKPNDEVKKLEKDNVRVISKAYGISLLPDNL